MNISSITDKNRSLTLYSLVITLFAINAYLAFIFSPELSKTFGYDTANMIFIRQFISIVFGIAIMYMLGKLNKDIWFNRIGVTIFVVSFIILVVMSVVPASFTPNIESIKLYLVIGGVTINPMLFFPIGALWLIAWSSDNKSKLFTNITIFILMIITAGFCIEFKNMGTLLILEALFIVMLVYINGISRFTIISIIATFGAGIVFILMAEHRIQRIVTWWELSSDFMTTLPIEKALHENILLSLMDKISIMALIVVLLIFIAIIYLILTNNYKNQSYKIFAVGIASLILIDLMLNVLYIFGLLPIYSSSIYMFGYGSSIIISSFLMIGLFGMLI